MNQKDKQIKISISLFRELMDNTIECINQADERGALFAKEQYQNDLDKCNEIILSLE